MNNKKTLILFDIDSTLLDAGGEAGIAFDEAFKTHFDIDDAGAGINKSGKTDGEILHEVCQVKLGRSLNKQELNTINSDYIHNLAGRLLKKAPQVLPGVPELLQELRCVKQVLVGIQTGNLELGARLKLKAADLNSYFDFGGFGSQAFSRKEIVKCAFDAAISLLDHEPENVFVVGDSLSDIEAAKANSFKPIAVATGAGSLETLMQHEPFLALTSLKDKEKFLGAVL